MPQRSGSGGSYAEAFRNRLAGAQSQMSNAQLQSKGPGYGSQAARVAAAPQRSPLQLSAALRASEFAQEPQPMPTATTSLVDFNTRRSDEVTANLNERWRHASGWANGYFPEWSPPVVDGGSFYAGEPRARTPEDSAALKPYADALNSYSVRPITKEDVQFNPLIQGAIADIRSVNNRNGAKVMGIDSDGNVLVRLGSGLEALVLAPGNEEKAASYPGYLDYTKEVSATGKTWMYKPVESVPAPSNGVVLGRGGQPQPGAKVMTMDNPVRGRVASYQGSDKGKREK